MKAKFPPWRGHMQRSAEQHKPWPDFALSALHSLTETRETVRKDNIVRLNRKQRETKKLMALLVKTSEKNLLNSWLAQCRSCQRCFISYHSTGRATQQEMNFPSCSVGSSNKIRDAKVQTQVVASCYCCAVLQEHRNQTSAFWCPTQVTGK